MIGEFDLHGVFVSSVLVSALAALAAVAVLQRLLGWLGAYRFIWHPALFDTALFVILWAAAVALPLSLPA
jgi:hypothetical protein